MKKEEVENRIEVEKVIKFLQIEAIRKTPVAKLPYGLQKRVELARALVAEPKVLLLDEPMAGMGTEEGRKILKILQKLKKRKTILLIEHDMDVVFALADRITVLVYGQVIASGSPQSIKKDEKVREAYLGSDGEINC